MSVVEVHERAGTGIIAAGLGSVLDEVGVFSDEVLMMEVFSCDDGEVSDVGENWTFRWIRQLRATIKLPSRGHTGEVMFPEKMDGVYGVIT
jgi:hypothetical protein